MTNIPIDDEVDIPLKQLTNLSPQNAKKEDSRAYRGLFYALFSALCLGLSNTLIKKAYIVTGNEQVFVRYTVQAIMMSAIILVERINFLGPVQSRKLLMIRGSFGAIGLLCMHFSVKMINPSDATALLQINAVIVNVLGRIFLKEKMSFTHLLSLIMSVLGVLFISQPTFLFGEKLPDIISYNSSQSNVTMMSEEFKSENQKFIGGISLALLGASLSALVVIVLKKLADSKVHYSIATIYASYFGGPVTLIMSTTFLLTGITKKDPSMLDDIPSFTLQVFYSLASGVLGTLSQITKNIALKHEDVSKIAIVRSTSVFFAYLFQYIWLGIRTNVYSGVGAFLIVAGVVLVLIYKILEKNLNLRDDKNDHIWTRFLLYKF